ncbi:hypothetical protein BaRGS_00011218 [Batillaria attramentaria]|uniref:Uncharacterized protein n=1 Tax=Batillaria attramentaria TaxID=370345 RepID=A0ABD0LEE0_9CAEN
MSPVNSQRITVQKRFTLWLGKVSSADLLLVGCVRPVCGRLSGSYGLRACVQGECYTAAGRPHRRTITTHNRAALRLAVPGDTQHKRGCALGCILTSCMRVCENYSSRTVLVGETLTKSLDLQTVWIPIVGRWPPPISSCPRDPAKPFCANLSWVAYMIGTEREKEPACLPLNLVMIPPMMTCQTVCLVVSDRTTLGRLHK